MEKNSNSYQGDANDDIDLSGDDIDPLWYFDPDPEDFRTVATEEGSNNSPQMIDGPAVGPTEEDSSSGSEVDLSGDDIDPLWYFDPELFPPFRQTSSAQNDTEVSPQAGEASGQSPQPDLDQPTDPPTPEV